MGIASWSSGFIVTGDGIDPTTANTFRNLDYGIRTFAYFGTNKPINIEYNLFEYNKTACYLSAETYAAVNRNKFVIKSGQTLITSDGYSGLYLDACTGYQVEENEFYSNYFPTSAWTYSRSYGLVVNNSGPEDNMIYNNNFHNLGWATQAQGINRDRSGTGLTIKCNDYTDNYQDINVLSSLQGDDYGIRSNQGADSYQPIAPAGNTFSHLNNIQNLYSDYYNDNQCGNITYWHHRQNIGSNTYVIPTYYTHASVFPSMNIDAGYFDKNNACPSNLYNKSQVVVRGDIVSNESSEEIYIDSLNLLVDDGNTTALNLDVATSLPPETMVLRDQLLNASPYLSDTVMVNAAAKEDVLPNSIITEVLSANPQSAKSDKVLSTLDERSLPPTENQYTIIHENDTVIGHRELLESKRSFYAGRKADNVYELTRLFMTDSLGQIMHDSISSALSNLHTTTSYYLRAFCNFNKGDSAGVFNILSDIPSEFFLNNAETDYYNYFNDYFDILLKKRSQQKSVSDIDSVQMSDVYDILNNTNGLLHAFARNLLIFTDEYEYQEPYLESDTSAEKSTMVKNDPYVHLWAKESYFKLYPNPAKEFITLEYNIGFDVSMPEIEIVTISGVQMYESSLSGSSGVKIIDLRNWQNGTYILRLVDKSKTLQSEKFIKY